jgi:2-polyprenyl-6-methoxyphenol hydroxylase-like FAD-dependent oxidoreductase
LGRGYFSLGYRWSLLLAQAAAATIDRSVNDMHRCSKGLTWLERRRAQRHYHSIPIVHRPSLLTRHLTGQIDNGNAWRKSRPNERERTTLVPMRSNKLHFSSSSSSSSYSFKGEKLRVAVVGGGCAGLSTALHLAPLVEDGLIAGPIDVFDDTATDRSGGGGGSREIGVGIWSTALDPFRQSSRTSHQLVYQSMSTAGTWLQQVGYRTMNGAWLMKSKLPGNEQEMKSMDMPALIFLREKDMLSALQKAVHWEELQGKTIRVHSSVGGVSGLFEESSQPWSTNLVLRSSSSSNPDEVQSSQPVLSERDYHLIVAADGTNSVLRQTYGGHETVERRLTGTSALPSPIELPHRISIIDPNEARNWDREQHEQAVGVQDRHYTVFRGNSSASRKELGQEDICFQTWGTRKSMRFATVSMYSPTPRGREEKQVWFITTDNDAISAEPDPTKRRDLLLQDFKDWHDPIRQIVSETSPEDILMERAIAHRHCMGPVLSFNSDVVQLIRGRRPPSSGEGPCIVFIGDAFMTVDPILAQGFTCAMEGAAALRKALENSSLLGGNETMRSERDPQLAFDPIQLRNVLKTRQTNRMERLICLLRATELVQALGQPSGDTTLSGLVNTKILRPLVAVTPNFIKAPIFDAVLKYSLGLGLFRKPN